MDRSPCSNIGTGCGRTPRPEADGNRAGRHQDAAGRHVHPRKGRARRSGLPPCRHAALRQLWPRTQGLRLRLAVAGEGPAHDRAAGRTAFSRSNPWWSSRIDGISRNERSNEFELVLLPLDGGVENPRCLGAVDGLRTAVLAGRRPDRRSADRIGSRHRCGPRADIPEQPARPSPCPRSLQRNRRSQRTRAAAAGSAISSCLKVAARR